MDNLPAIIPTKRAALEGAAAYFERDLANARSQATRSDETGAAANEHYVLQVMHLASCAAILRAMAEAEPAHAPEYRSVRGTL